MCINLELIWEENLKSCPFCILLKFIGIGYISSHLVILHPLTMMTKLGIYGSDHSKFIHLNKRKERKMCEEPAIGPIKEISLIDNLTLYLNI